MSNIIIPTCDFCDMPLARRHTVEHQGKVACQLACARSLWGARRAFELYEAKGQEINARNGRYQRARLKVVNQ